MEVTNDENISLRSTLSLLFMKMKKLNPRQRNVVYRSLGFADVNEEITAGRDEKILEGFFKIYEEKKTLSKEMVHTLERAIEAAAYEKVLEPCVEELKRLVESLTLEERNAIIESELEFLDGCRNYEDYQRQYHTSSYLQTRTSDIMKSLQKDIEEYRRLKEISTRLDLPKLKNLVKALEDWQNCHASPTFSKDVAKEKLALLQNAMKEYTSSVNPFSEAVQSEIQSSDDEDDDFTPLTIEYILKRLAALPSHWRSYFYGRIDRKELIDMTPEMALCRFFGVCGAYSNEGASKDRLEYLDNTLTDVEGMI